MIGLEWNGLEVNMGSYALRETKGHFGKDHMQNFEGNMGSEDAAIQAKRGRAIWERESRVATERCDHMGEGHMEEGKGHKPRHQ